MGWVSVSDYDRSQPDPLADSMAGIIQHMNADHEDTLVLLARTFARIESTEANDDSSRSPGFSCPLDSGIVGLPGRISVTASFADIDNDGDQDLFVTTVLGGNALFENDGHGHFRDITKASGLDLVAHSSGAVFFDYNNDGLLDLLVCDVGRYTSREKGAQGQYVGLADAFSGHLHPDPYEYPVLYKNLGHNRFQDVIAEVGLRPAG